MIDAYPLSESLSDITEAIDHGLGALDVLESVRDVNASEVREHVVQALVFLTRLKHATVNRIEDAKRAEQGPRPHPTDAGVSLIP